MELQNISINFEDNTITSLYTDVVYYVPTITNIETLKTNFDSIYDIDIKKLVIQFTFDQNLSQPRIIINPGFDDTMIISIDTIKINHSQLYDELIIARIEIELEIKKQNNEDS
jgi:hypothetical protein